jgi:hypothetical protein
MLEQTKTPPRIVRKRQGLLRRIVKDIDSYGTAQMRIFLKCLGKTDKHVPFAEHGGLAYYKP